MARKQIKKPQGLYSMSLLNTDNKVDIWKNRAVRELRIQKYKKQNKTKGQTRYKAIQLQAGNDS